MHQIKKAIRLSPIYPAWYFHIIGASSFALGEHEEAVRAYRACVKATDPDSAFMPIVRVWLAICLASAGHDAEAKSLRAKEMKNDPAFRIEDWWLTPRKDFSVRDRAVKIWNEIASS